MAKRKITIPVDVTPGETPQEDEATVTGVALITPTFTELAKFTMPNLDESIKIIEDKRKENTALIIDGVEDKIGYEAVKSAMKQMKDDRLAFVDAATSNVIKPAKDYLKQFEEDLEKIVVKFKGGEQDMRDKKDFIDKEKIRIKQEAELEKVRVMQVRVSDLHEFGAAFDGKVYTFPYSQMLMVTAADVKDLSDDKFSEFKAQVKEAFDAEQERINNKKAADALLAEQQRLQAEQNERDMLALKERRTKIRLKELKILAYKHEPVEDIYYNDTIPINIPMDRVTDDTDEVWDELIYDLEHFTPAEEPLVAYEPDNTINVSFTPSWNQSNDSARPEESDEQQVLDEIQSGGGRVESEPPSQVELSLEFTLDNPYTDTDISPKMFMRVYPDEYADFALHGHDSVANQGTIQTLNWVILKK